VDLSAKDGILTEFLGLANLGRILRAKPPLRQALLEHLGGMTSLSEDVLYDLIARIADIPRCTARDLEAVEFGALLLLPSDLCRRVCAIPLREDAWGNLVVAMADPFDETAKKELAAASERSIRVEIAPEKTIRQALDRLYGPDASNAPQFLADDDDLRTLFAAAEGNEADFLEVVECAVSKAGQS